MNFSEHPSALQRKPALRWFAPLALLAVVGGSTLLASTADADPTLPAKSAEQLLVDVQAARVDGLSGTVVQKADLGLPALPSSGSATTEELTSLLSGNHTFKVWTAGPDKSRIALLDDLAETDVILSGRDLWTYSSKTDEATHRTLPDPAGLEARKAPDSADLPTTPQEAAARVLDAVGPTTEVSTDASATVAGRDAYELVLAPRDTRSLIEQIRISVDAETSVPLELEAIAKGGTTVFDVAYTEVSFEVPDAEQFAFNPRPGTTVTEAEVPQLPDEPTAAEKKSAEQKAADAESATTTVGEGWTTVVVTELPAGTTDAPELAGVLNGLEPVTGPWGSGRLFSGPAFSAVLTDDGRLAVGAVDRTLLVDALAK